MKKNEILLKVAMTIIMLEEVFNKGFGKLKDVAFCF